MTKQENTYLKAFLDNAANLLDHAQNIIKDSGGAGLKLYNVRVILEDIKEDVTMYECYKCNEVSLEYENESFCPHCLTSK